jgi:tetratricopeptide (TPR) repeat protein
MGKCQKCGLELPHCEHRVDYPVAYDTTLVCRACGEHFGTLRELCDAKRDLADTREAVVNHLKLHEKTVKELEEARKLLASKQEEAQEWHKNYLMGLEDNQKAWDKVNKLENRLDTAYKEGMDLQIICYRQLDDLRKVVDTMGIGWTYEQCLMEVKRLKEEATKKSRQECDGCRVDLADALEMEEPTLNWDDMLKQVKRYKGDAETYKRWYEVLLKERTDALELAERYRVLHAASLPELDEVKQKLATHDALQKKYDDALASAEHYKKLWVNVRCADERADAYAWLQTRLATELGVLESGLSCEELLDEVRSLKKVCGMLQSNAAFAKGRQDGFSRPLIDPVMKAGWATKDICCRELRGALGLDLSTEPSWYDCLGLVRDMASRPIGTLQGCSVVNTKKVGELLNGIDKRVRNIRETLKNHG